MQRGQWGIFKNSRAKSGKQGGAGSLATFCRHLVGPQLASAAAGAVLAGLLVWLVLAAPLEARTKGWQLPVLLCDQTARLLREKAKAGEDRAASLASCLVQLGPVRLAGMQRPETVFALLDQPLAAGEQAALARSVALYEAGEGR